MILSELLPFLEQLGAAPRRSLSQNFLIDPNIVRKILRSAEVKPQETILEIGPGPGALTAALLDAGATVYAVEKDRLFANALSRLQTADQRLIVVQADALEVPLTDFPAKKVVANLPYHITTPLLERLFLSGFSSLTLMVQKEFAERLAAKPGSKNFSSLTLFSQFYASLKDSFPVSSHCFYPKPQVDSSVVRLDLHTPPLDKPEPFFHLIRTAFQQRRKMMSSSLESILPSAVLKQRLTEIGFRADARPEMLSLSNWLLLFRALQN